MVHVWNLRNILNLDLGEEKNHVPIFTVHSLPCGCHSHFEHTQQTPLAGTSAAPVISFISHIWIDIFISQLQLS